MKVSSSPDVLVRSFGAMFAAGALTCLGYAAVHSVEAAGDLEAAHLPAAAASYMYDHGEAAFGYQQGQMGEAHILLRSATAAAEIGVGGLVVASELIGSTLLPIEDTPPDQR